MREPTVCCLGLDGFFPKQSGSGVGASVLGWCRCLPMMGVPTLPTGKTSPRGGTPRHADGTFAAPDLTTFCRLDGLGLVVTGQRVEPDRAVLACRVVDDEQCCRRCGCQGRAHRPHPDPRRHRPSPAAGHGRRTLQGRVQDRAHPTSPGLARPSGSGRDGRVHRVQDRRRRRAPDGGRGDGPASTSSDSAATPSTGAAAACNKNDTATAVSPATALPGSPPTGNANA